MRSRWMQRLACGALVTGSWLGLGSELARADGLFSRWRSSEGCCTPQPSCSPTSTTPSSVLPPPVVDPSKPPVPTMPEPGQQQAEPESNLESRSLSYGGGVVSLLGDVLSIPAIAFGPRPAGALGLATSSTPVPSVRSFKIADNESPRPRDRVYLSFNYFDDVNKASNLRLGSSVSDIKVYRETFGLEKTFLDRQASIGFRLPLNTLSADSTFSQLAGTNTDIGDLTIISKFLLLQNQDYDLLSAGLAVTVPTGPDNFAGSGAISLVHTTILQPYMGYILNFDRWFLHGFTAIDVPMDSADVTMFYEDLGVGYVMYRSQEQSRILTSIIPTMEVHVNVPLNHRGAFDIFDGAATADVVNLTTGVTFGLGQRSQLAGGIVVPVSGPRPFDYEIQAQFNYRFGSLGGSSRPGLLGN